MRQNFLHWERFQSIGALLASIPHLASPAGRAAFLRHWRAIPDFGRGIAIGLVLAILINLAHNLAFIGKIEDSGLDWMIRINRGAPLLAEAEPPPVSFFDIDERSYRQWGEPLSIPRDKLLSLIRYAVDGGAAVVVVDVELSRPAPSPAAADDRALSEYLRNFPPPGLASVTHILLVRGLRHQLEDPALFEQRSSFLDAAVGNNAHVHWAAPLFALDDDGLLRRWRLWQCTEQPGTHRVVTLPSFQRLATDLLKGTASPSPCAPPEAVATDALDRYERRLAEHILFSLPWQLHRGETYPTRQWQDESNYPVFAIRPAVTITEVPPAGPHQDLKGQLVVIGASYVDARDSYVTPLGEMPGAMVIANAFRSLFSKGELEESKALKYLLEVVLIVLVAIVFALLPGLLAKLVASAVTLFVLLPFSLQLYRSGVWLDFAIPLAVVEIHAMIGEFQKFFGDDAGNASEVIEQT